MASSVARSCTYWGIASHISWLTALRFSGWLKTIQPIAPSFSITSFDVGIVRSPDLPRRGDVGRDHRFHAVSRRRMGEGVGDPFEGKARRDQAVGAESRHHPE